MQPNQTGTKPGMASMAGNVKEENGFGLPGIMRATPYGQNEKRQSRHVCISGMPGLMNGSQYRYSPLEGKAKDT